MNNGKRKGNILLIANYESNVGYAWALMENFWAVIAMYYLKENRNCYLLFPKITKISKVILESPIIVLEHDFFKRTINAKRKLKKIIVENNIKSIYLTDRGQFDFNFYQFRRWGIDTIICHLHWGGHGFKENRKIMLNHITKFVKKILFSFQFITCNYYICVSSLIYNKMITFIPKDKCITIVNGIKPIDIDEKYKDYANKLLNIPKQALIIVTTGRATYQKGIIFLIECADILINRRKLNNLYFLHCGDGPDLLNFIKRVKKYGLEKRFLFAGKRNDIRNILQSCHIGIQASEGEAFSLSILEYMSARLATLIPNNSGNIEGISDGKNGLLYPPKNHEYVVNTIVKLAKNTKLRQRLGEAAAKTILEKYSLAKTNDKLLEFISKRL